MGVTAQTEGVPAFGLWGFDILGHKLDYCFIPCHKSTLSHLCLLVSISTVGSRSIQPPGVFPLIPIVNELCNIECCVNNMLQIIQNMLVSQCLELELSMFRGTTLSGQHPLMQVWVQNFQKYSTPRSHCYIIISSSKPYRNHILDYLKC